MAPRKTVMRDNPRDIAEILLEHPGEWYPIGRAPRDDSRSLRSAAHRLKVRKFRAFEKQVGDRRGFWEVTVRTQAADPYSVMYARWVAL